MSGGQFDYIPDRIDAVADEIIREADENTLSDDIRQRFREAAYNLRRASEMAQRVDWFLSGDDGEDSFRERWHKEVRAPWSE